MNDAAFVSYVMKSETGQTDIIVTSLSSAFKNSDSSDLPHIYRYTLAELVNKLPDNIAESFLYIDKAECAVYYSFDYYDGLEEALIFKKGDTLLDAVYEMYCWYVENEASLRMQQNEFEAKLLSAIK